MNGDPDVYRDTEHPPEASLFNIETLRRVLEQVQKNEQNMVAHHEAIHKEAERRIRVLMSRSRGDMGYAPQPKDL